jgi:hypothetical protein
VTQDQTIVIPRAEATTSGDHFEVLVGFEVTPRWPSSIATATASAPTPEPAPPSRRRSK